MSTINLGNILSNVGWTGAIAMSLIGAGKALGGLYDVVTRSVLIAATKMSDKRNGIQYNAEGETHRNRMRVIRQGKENLVEGLKLAAMGEVAKVAAVILLGPVPTPVHALVGFFGFQVIETHLLGRMASGLAYLRG